MLCRFSYKRDKVWLLVYCYCLNPAPTTFHSPFTPLHNCHPIHLVWTMSHVQVTTASMGYILEAISGIRFGCYKFPWIAIDKDIQLNITNFAAYMESPNMFWSIKLFAEMLWTLGCSCAEYELGLTECSFCISALRVSLDIASNEKRIVRKLCLLTIIGC